MTTCRLCLGGGGYKDGVSEDNVRSVWKLGGVIKWESSNDCVYFVVRLSFYEHLKLSPIGNRGAEHFAKSLEGTGREDASLPFPHFVATVAVLVSWHFNLASLTVGPHDHFSTGRKTVNELN